MLNDKAIEKASRMMGIPRTNVKSIFQNDIDKGADINQLLENVESVIIIGVLQKLHLEELYNSFIADYIKDTILEDTALTDDTFKSEAMMKIWKLASKHAKERLIKWIQENDKFIRVNRTGKDITSKCSKLPHIPHYDINDKTFCCGVSGDIELLDYSIRIITMIDKIRGNKYRMSAMKGAYKLQIIKN